MVPADGLVPAKPTAAPLTLVEVTSRAIGLLTRELGPVDAARFVAQFSGGSGDYTADRVALFADRSVAELAAEIRASVISPAASTES